MEFTRNEKIAIAKGFFHAVALPFLFTLAVNVFMGIGWMLFVSYLYRSVFDKSKSLNAFWFFTFVKIWILAIVGYIWMVLAASM
ncbi:hypothetical protein [Nitrosophilus labii]|uniref:hypothetical protein n=1 Tax=Nitrosophilus labii TaxID=2706014 RepID=UPI001657458C|nr:hypothetical protein [Nitrosophilus labii]